VTPFGLLAVSGHGLVKQGWSFGGAPSGARIPGVDLRREALHTTGTFGAGDRYIVAAFTLHPAGTRYPTACRRVTGLIKRIVPGA
jgi:hypothetical protein